ncbi:MAG: hypothetical protein ACK5HT_16270 [Draconibacterium sp.]
MKMRLTLILFFSFTTVVSVSSQENLPYWNQMAPPDTTGIWIQPSRERLAMPVWGHVNGIQVGLAPLPGPRGLLRIYTPYLGLERAEVMNFIALEPIPKGNENRGLSELEMSSIDKGKRGKRFWSSNESTAVIPLNEDFPARGLVENINGEETLTLYIFSEPFDNGARVYVRLRFFESRPYEFSITTYTYEGSVDLDYFITTATMGNKARLRTLYLKDGQKSALEIWPEYEDIHFTPHQHFTQKEMIKDKNGRAYFMSKPKEKDYSKAVYAPGTSGHWQYHGKAATQYWIKEKPNKNLKGLVNGRFAYWASDDPIPGGIAFENFEMKEPFQNGATFFFGISQEKLDEIIGK